MASDLSPAEQLLLLADELRGAATAARTFAANMYDRERADHLSGIAGRLAALTGIADADDLVATFTDEAWKRTSPMVGVSTLARDEAGKVLLCRRTDDASWCLPGGLLEIGEPPTVGALRELWEEAGVTGEVTRLLGVFDGPTWGSRSSVHQIAITFEVNVSGAETPVPGEEMSAAQYFPVDALPEPLHHGQRRRIPVLLDLVRTGGTHHDPASTVGQNATLPMFQRPR
ncbi:NUDIX domain-containing protein [Microlunatus sp. GCM10028923]|uniref:NUDIX domain-containing protein n=1 Tax=Microlunatus sp. GCM10028923 TaxID=3273400 RepID=UPI00361DAF54